MMLPIPGTSKVAHLEENVRAGVMRITEREWQELEDAITGMTGII